MGDVVIGENANVKAHSVVMPKSRIDDNQTV
jgi:acetyltransferase-like isoleucine patch superfamily enzyme